MSLLEPGLSPGFSQVRSWVHSTLGIEFPDEKLDSFKRRVDQVMNANGIPDYLVLYDQLKSTRFSQLHVSLSQAMTTNHTAFFREPKTLEDLFVGLGPVPEQPLRIWSAACSTGQEAYSLAMLARERFGDEAERYLAILGTDISQGAVSQASAGRYPERFMGPVSPARRERFFTQDETEWTVRDGLKELCMFRRLNLAVGRWPFQRRFHAIYCRNVLYYFDKELRERVAQRLFEVLAPGGRLYTSVTESLQGMNTPLRFVGPGIYERSPA